MTIKIPEPVGATYTIAGVQHCTLTVSGPDTDLYTAEQVRQAVRDALEEAAQLAFSWNTAIMDVLANEIRNLKATK